MTIAGSAKSLDAAKVTDPTESYLPLLVAGDADGVLALFGNNEPVIEDPRAGRVTGVEGVRRFVAEATAFWAEGSTTVLHLRTTRSEVRTVSEDILSYQKEDWHNGVLELPVAVVASVDSDQAVTALHVYFTNWPFNGRHSIRRAFVSPEAGAHHTDIVARYVEEGLMAGDVSAILNTQDADLYFREPSGPPYVHWGRAAVGKFFEGLFGQGPAHLEPNTVTDDGRCSIMEFSVFGWNGEQWPEEKHQAGLAVYERGESGLLRAIRLYDDVQF
jgi:hypothetical protein